MRKFPHGYLFLYAFGTDTLACGTALENDEKAFPIRKNGGGDKRANFLNFLGRAVAVVRGQGVADIFCFQIVVNHPYEVFRRAFLSLYPHPFRIGENPFLAVVGGIFCKQGVYFALDCEIVSVGVCFKRMAYIFSISIL